MTSNMPKKMRKGFTNRQQNGGESKQNDHWDSAGPSSAQNSISIEPNPDVNKIPLNKNGTFIEKIFVSCSFCSQTFDRPDYYYLHHAEKHAKLYGHLPKPDSIEEKDTAGHKDGAYLTQRKRRCSVYVNHENEDSSSSETSELSSNEKTNDPNIDNEPRKSSTNAETKRKRKSKSNKLKHENYSTSSDDSVRDIRIFLKKLDRKLQHFKSRMRKRLKCKRSLVYKCRICSLHFLNEYEWRKHKKHVVNAPKCKYCMLKFSDNSLKKHENMHTKGGKIQKLLKYYVVTHKSYDYTSSESDSDISPSKSFDLHDKESKTDHSSKPGTSETYAEPTTNNKELKPNKDDKNDLNNHDYVKKKYKAKLFKCDDCEEHFLTKRNLEIHTKNSTHYYRMEKKNSQCNVCTIKFSSAATLLRHRRLHHHSRLNLVKEDFLIITSTKFNNKMPEGIKLANSKYLVNRNIQGKKIIPNRNTKNTSNVGNQDKMYKCEGCHLHFMNYSTWIYHLNQPICYKNEFNRKECPICKVYFTNRIWIDHMKIHKLNPSCTKNSFKMFCRMPNRLKVASMPQSDVVSTTGKDLDSNACNSVPHADQEPPLNPNQNTGNAEPCKVKLAKSTAGRDKWQVISNRSEDVLNTNTTEPNNDEDTMIATVSKNDNQNSEHSHINNEQSTPSHNNTVNVLSCLNTTTLNQVSNANMTSLHNNDQTASLADASKSFGENIMVDIPNTVSSNKEAQTIITRDTTIEVSNTHTTNREINPNESQNESASANARISGTTGDELIKKKVNYSEKQTNNSDIAPSVKKESIEAETISNRVNVPKENDTGNNDQAMSEINIKSECDVTGNKMAEQYIEVKAENSIVKEEKEIKSETYEDTPTTNLVTTHITDDVKPENNTSFAHVKIANSFSLGLQFEEPSSSGVFNSENDMDNVDSTETFYRNTTHEIVKEYESGESSSNRKVDKIQQREVVDDVDSDDSEATVLLENYNDIKYEPTFDCNDATMNTNSMDPDEINNILHQNQNVTDQIPHEPGKSLSENNVSVPTPDTTQETVTSNGNTTHIRASKGVTSTSISLDECSSEFRVRDRSEAKNSADDFVIVFDSTRIKNEKAQEIQAQNRRCNRQAKEGVDNTQQIINLTNEDGENDDFIMEPQIVATIDLSDDD